MIDREARDKFAESLRHLVAGTISNEEFEDRLPLRSSDDGVNKVFWHGAWHLYDDLRGYKLSGTDGLSGEVKKEVARWILFLRSDFEYEWPYTSGPLTGCLTNLLTLGLAGNVFKKQMEAAGDFDVWPFIRRQDYEEVLSSPQYLRKPSNKAL